MPSSRRVAHGAAALALAAALVAGCSAPEDDDGLGPLPTRPSTTTSTSKPSGGFTLPPKNEVPALDPVTKGKCDGVYDFQLFNFAIHTSSDRGEAEVKRLTDGIKEHETHVIGVLPEMAENVKLLSADAQKLMQNPPTPGVTLTPEISTANGVLLDFLRGTCKMID